MLGSAMLRAATVVVTLVFVSACAGAKLERVGNAMIRVERGTEGVVDGVSAAKDAVKEECVSRQLQTEAERMKCVEDILEVVRGSKVAVAAVRAALVSFWTFYPIMEAKLERGEKLGPEDLQQLAAHAHDVYAAYQVLVEYAKEIRP